MYLPLAAGRKRRNWILLLAVAGITGYGAYRLYNLPAVAERRRKLAKLVKTLASVAESVSSSADVVSLVSADLNSFLRLGSDEIPNSIRRIAKIASSDEFAASVSRVSEAVTVGVVRALQGGASSGWMRSEFSERILDRVFSSSGAGFVSVVAGSFAKGLVMGLYSSDSAGRKGGVELGGDELPRWVHLVCAEKSRQMIGDCIQRFVGTAVTVYFEKTRNVNTYDDMFSGLAHPKHEAKMKELLVSVCNGAVETLVKTSHEVLMLSSKVGSSVDGEEGGKQGGELGRSSGTEKVGDGGGGGWVGRMSSTLAAPSNRSFVLDLTGRVTFDTVRSFLEFMLGRFRDSVRSGVGVFRQEIVGRGLDMVWYVSAKTMLVLTICLSLCLHLMPGTKLLVPA